ncbi:alpha/beta fold hydrolase [Edaphobacter flagellatus]|uniref:alpha/beta fold hydrolase n=1 Tax=Edaphobacter flagellatus TaxID=1933044 RepID=UPI0021B2BA39|nr:alpha/beta hydrolase [Edaphobacter flagellatus]
MKRSSMNTARRMMLFALLTLSLHAQQIAGTWQGTLDLGQQKLRIVLQIDKAADSTLKGTVYSIDQGPDPAAVTTLSFANPTLKFVVDSLHASYEGTMSADGKTITGTVTQGAPKPLVFERATQETAWKIDPSPHTVQMISVDKDVKLEVLDWGGTGRPLVLLTGLGNNAHVFDKFAPKLAATYHVYGITRRGFGVSSKPEAITANYTATRLGDDVLAVIEALHINKPIVAGHSIAGEELSYIGSQHPDKVAGLIYLDAGYPYAMYDQVNGDFLIDAIDLRRQLNQILDMNPDADRKKALDGVIADLKFVEKGAIVQRQRMEDLPPPQWSRQPPPPVGTAIMLGQQRFTTINAPALAIFATPKDLGQLLKDNPKARAALQAANNHDTEQQATAFERQVPAAHVVRIPNASHYVFVSNEADVLREMNAFIAMLPAAN